MEPWVLSHKGLCKLKSVFKIVLGTLSEANTCNSRVMRLWGPLLINMWVASLDTNCSFWIVFKGNFLSNMLILAMIRTWVLIFPLQVGAKGCLEWHSSSTFHSILNKVRDAYLDFCWWLAIVLLFVSFSLFPYMLFLLTSDWDFNLLPGRLSRLLWKQMPLLQWNEACAFRLQPDSAKVLGTKEQIAMWCEIIFF